MMRSDRTVLTIEGIEFEVRLKRMKTIRFHIESPDGNVWVSAPVGTSLERIERALTPKIEYIRMKQAEIRARPQTALANPLDHGAHRLLGVDVPLITVPGSGNRVRVQLQDGELRVTSNVIDHPELLRNLLDEIQTKALRNELMQLMSHWEARMGRSASWWGIRRMKTRWGSCSPRSGRIRFSVNLGTQHPREIEYIVVHELAHLFVPNHSPDFWSLVEHHLPDWRSSEAILNPRSIRRSAD